jgi:outer membrane protein OmpA-like peptidoglycan-associated protein
MRRFLVLFLVLGFSVSTVALAAAEEHRAVVYFPSWSADIDDNASKSIDEAAQWATSHPREIINVLGYASTVGSKRANALLADLRSQVVVDYLMSKGVAASRIKMTSKGATRYLDSPLESRRVEMVMTSK